jgi:hypothetical protein
MTTHELGIGHSHESVNKQKKPTPHVSRAPVSLNPLVCNASIGTLPIVYQNAQQTSDNLTNCRRSSLQIRRRLCS